MTLAAKKEGEGPLVEYTHFGVCCGDLERSVHFYCHALGFSEQRRMEIGLPFETLLELPGFHAKTAFLQQEGRVLELIEFVVPETTGSGERRPMNQRGLTHLCFNVANLQEVCRRIESAGGRAHYETLTELSVSDIIFCTDPDGTRIELVKVK